MRPADAGPDTLAFALPFALALAFALALIGAGCVRSARMCAAESECGSAASCVAGRCVQDGAVPAVDSTRRFLFPPVDGALVRRGASRADVFAGPRVATLGRDDGAIMVLRFALELPPESNVVEAYLLLPRRLDLDTDPTPIVLQAEGIVEPWVGAEVTAIRPPHHLPFGAPKTRLLPTRTTYARLDVRALVTRWLRRPGDDFGIAIVAEASGGTGVSLALDPVPAPLAAISGPVLEVYVK